MSGAMNRHCIPGLTMSTALTGNFMECVQVGQTTAQGLAQTRIALCQRPSRHEKTGRVILAWWLVCS